MLDIQIEKSGNNLEYLVSTLSEPSDIDFEEEYTRFKEEITSLWDTKSAYNQNPLMYCIFEAEESVDSVETLKHKDQESQLRFNRHGLDAIFLGRILKELSETPIIRPSGERIDKTLGEVYAHDLLFSDDFWDTYYELDIASTLSTAGIPTQLVDEGEQSGPDLRIFYEGQEIWIECKRKRKYTEKERGWRAVETEVDRQIWDHDDLCCRNFAIEITCDELLEPEYTPGLAETVVRMVNNRIFDEKVTIGDTSIRLRIHDLSHRDTESEVWDMAFTKVNYEFQRENPNEKMPNPQSDESYKFDLRNGGYYKLGFRTAEDGEEYQVNHIVDLDVPWDIDFHKKLENTIQTGRDRVSGFSPSVLMIDIPPRWAEVMKTKAAENPDGEIVSQAERMEGICYKEFNDSDSLNAISVNTRLWNMMSATQGLFEGEARNIVQREDVRTYANTSPESPLPEKFMRWVL
jgi:hypothetical protein